MVLELNEIVIKQKQGKPNVMELFCSVINLFQTQRSKNKWQKEKKMTE